MKRIISLVSSFVLVFSLLYIPAYADENTADTEIIDVNEINNEDSDIQVSAPMSFSEMVNHYMEVNGVSYDEALKAFPVRLQKETRASATYRTLSVSLTVTSTCRPRIEFYCRTSESGSYWGILSIYSVQLVRSYSGISKQFTGNISVWLRSAYQIEYTINGDFYNNGTTTVSGGGGLDLGIGESVNISLSASMSYESNHYKYFYEHRTVAFQS